MQVQRVQNNTNFNGFIHINERKIVVSSESIDESGYDDGLNINTKDIKGITRIGSNKNDTLIKYGKNNEYVVLKKGEYENVLRAYTAADSKVGTDLFVEV